MATRQIPASSAPEPERIEPEKVKFQLFRVAKFPLALLGGKLDKDVDANPWLLGLLADLKDARGFINPVIVWNHHANRLTGKQPYWLLRAGSNRVWCAEQLRWTHAPAIVSVMMDDGGALETLAHLNPSPVDVRLLQAEFPDGGVVWANDYGFGLLQAKKPELTYANYRPTAAEKASVTTTAHGATKIGRP